MGSLGLPAVPIIVDAINHVRRLGLRRLIRLVILVLVPAIGLTRVSILEPPGDLANDASEASPMERTSLSVVAARVSIRR